MEPGLLHSADWPVIIDIYFFLGGLAGGAFLIAAAAQWLDSQPYRDVIRWATTSRSSPSSPARSS